MACKLQQTKEVTVDTCRQPAASKQRVDVHSKPEMGEFLTMGFAQKVRERN